MGAAVRRNRGQLALTAPPQTMAGSDWHQTLIATAFSLVAIGNPSLLGFAPVHLKPEPSTDVPHGCLPGLTREMTNDGEKGHQRSTSKNAHKPEHHHDNHNGHYGSHNTTHYKIPSVGTGSSGKSDNNRA